MSHFAERVHAPSAKQSESGPARPRPRERCPMQRGAMWHVLQLRAAEAIAAAPSPRAPGRGGLPDRLRAGLERLSGLFMGDVRVHRGSPEPAKLGALAYTKGSDIHLGPGQEQHLPHEAWHVVQQKEGRVRATTQLKGKSVNHDSKLEAEADAMGTRAERSGEVRDAVEFGTAALIRSAAPGRVVQRMIEQKSSSSIDPMAASPVARIVATNLAAFNSQQLKPPDRAMLLTACIKAVEALDDLSRLWQARELVDFLVPVYSDAVLVSASERNARELVESKQSLLALRLLIEARFQKLIRADPAALTMERLQEWAASIRAAGAFLAKSQKTIEETLTAAPPAKTGSREPRDIGEEEEDTRIDIRAAALAKAVKDDGFVPDLVVGLPTGGIQIAARVAGILGATSEAMPKLLAIRPRFVKETGAKNDAPREQLDRTNIAELESVAQGIRPEGPALADPRNRTKTVSALGIGGLAIGASFGVLAGIGLGVAAAVAAYFGTQKLWKPIKILVVDDFSLSGNSLSQAADLIRGKFGELGKDVQVKTALSRYTSHTLGNQKPPSTLDRIDYLVGQHGSGTRQALRAKFLDPEGAILKKMQWEASFLDRGWTQQGKAALDLPV